MPVPKVSPAEQFSRLEKLRHEKDVIGFYLSGHPLDDYKTEIENFATVRLEHLQDLSKLRGRDVAFAGIVSEANHRISKNGKPFGSIKLEDFSHSFELALFSEDYLKFKHLLEVNECLLVTGFSQPTYRDPTVYELKIKDIKLLSTLFNNFNKDLILNIPLNKIDKKFTHELQNVLVQYKGKNNVNVNIVNENNEVIQFQSKKFNVEISSEFLDSIQKLELNYQFK